MTISALIPQFIAAHPLEIKQIGHAARHAATALTTSPNRTVRKTAELLTGASKQSSFKPVSLSPEQTASFQKAFQNLGAQSTKKVVFQKPKKN